MIDNQEQINEDFDKLLNEFIKSELGDFDNEVDEEILDEEDDENLFDADDENLEEDDNDAAEPLTFGNYGLDNEPESTDAEPARKNQDQRVVYQGQAYMLPMSPKTIQSVPDTLIFVYDTQTLHEFEKPIFVSNTDDQRLVVIFGFEDYRYEIEGEKMLLSIFKVGNKLPILTETLSISSYEARCELNLKDKGISFDAGHYLVTVSGLNLEKMNGFFPFGDAYAANLYAVSEKDIDLCIDGANVSAPRNACDKVKVELQAQLDHDSVDLFDLECYTADTYTYVCSSRRNGKLAHTLRSVTGWTEGQSYRVYVYVNKHFAGCVDFTYSRKSIPAKATKKTDADAATMKMALACSPFTRDPQKWHSLTAMLGATALKQEYAHRLYATMINEARIKHGFSQEINFNQGYIIYGEANTACLDFAAELSEPGCADYIAYDGSKELQAKEAADARMQTFTDESTEIDLDKRPAVIINPQDLANERMGDWMAMLRKELERNPKFRISIVGSRSDVDRLLSAHPWLEQYYPQHCRLEIASPTPAEFVNAVDKSLLFRYAMHLSNQQKKKIAKKYADCADRGPWTDQKVVAFVDNTIISNFTARLLRESKNGQWTSKQISTVKDQDIDLSIFESISPESLYDESVRKLNSLIGLTAVKETLANIFRRAKFFAMRREAGLQASAIGVYHAILTGNPGTGKTTVAKLMGKVFKALGVISKGDVVVVDRKALVGQYLGDTEKNTRMALERAKGNVLFIDEAYNLYTDADDKRDYGRRVIDSLMTVLSAPNPDMVVILAGYEKEMEGMLRVNSGLESRFPLRLKFPDYDASELLEIAKSMAKAEGFYFSQEAEKALLAAIVTELKSKGRDFGNGRWVEQILHHDILEAMAARVITSGGDLSRIEAADVKAICKPAANRRQSIGFR